MNELFDPKMPIEAEAVTRAANFRAKLTGTLPLQLFNHVHVCFE